MHWTLAYTTACTVLQIKLNDDKMMTSSYNDYSLLLLRSRLNVCYHSAVHITVIDSIISISSSDISGWRGHEENRDMHTYTHTHTHTHMERERRAMMTMSHNATHVTDSRSSSPHSTASVLTDPSIHSLTPPTSVRQLTSLPHCFSFRILYSSFIICLPHNIRPNSPFGIARRKPFRAILAVLNMIIHAN